MVTRLDVINHMLSVVGESGISDAGSLHPSVVTAKRILHTQDLDFQGPGWWFNREYGLVLAPNASGEVHVPGSTMDMKLSNVQNASVSDKTRYVKRGTRIYDNRAHTFNIGHSVAVDIVLQLEIGDLPSVAGSFLMHSAGLAMYVDDDGDSYKTEKLEQRVSQAWQKLRAAELKTIAVNALDSPTARRLRMPGSGQRSPNSVGTNT